MTGTLKAGTIFFNKHVTSAHHAALPEAENVNTKCTFAQTHLGCVSSDSSMLSQAYALFALWLNTELDANPAGSVDASEHAAVCCYVGVEDHAAVCGVQEGRPTCPSGMPMLTATTVQVDCR